MITPRPYMVLAANVDSFVGNGIEFFSILNAIREGNFDPKRFVATHIGITVLNENGELCVCEMMPEGCVMTKWAGSRYQKNEVRFILFDFIEPLTPYERLEMQCWCWNDARIKKKYDYPSIGCYMLQAFKGIWLGKKGKAAENRFHCSEQIATYINRLRPFFKYPWKTSPMKFVLESTGILLKPVYSNYNLTK
jgi:hypothetical protein